MIQANELRLGNWLGSRWVSEPDRVDFFQVNHIRENEDWSMMEPIPLTPELLEKAGFIIPYKDGFFQIVHSGVVKIKIHEIVKLPIVEIGDIQFVQVLYVHQLQNLFFSLCGEELNIEL